MINSGKFRVFIIILMMIGWYGTVLSQDKNKARLFHIQVKDGQEVSFETALKAHAEWRKEQGDPWNWTVYQCINGNYLGDFFIYSGQHSWKDFDTYQSFSMKGAKMFNKNVGPHINKMKSVILAEDKEVSRWTKKPENVRMLVIEEYYLKPGHEMKWSNSVKEIHKAIVENDYDAHYSLEWTVNGGKGGVATFVSPLENWADMEPPQEKMYAFLKRVLGKEKTDDLFKDFMDSFSYSKSFMLAVRPELSVWKDK